MTDTTPLPRAFYLRPAEQLAQDLLGKLLVSRSGGELTSGVIVETEAYLPHGDAACHAVRGETKSNRSMFGKAGLSYVYPIHAKYCFNVVAEEAGTGTAVLIRALQPEDGIETMMRRRQTARPLDLCRGPARLCQALAIDRGLDGHDLLTGSCQVKHVVR